MFKGTFNDIAEITSKKYSQKARDELEKQIGYYTKTTSNETIKQLGLPQVLMFLSSSIAKSNNHDEIDTLDVQEAFSIMRYLITRDFLEKILENDTLNFGLPQIESRDRRLDKLLQIKGDMKTKNNLEGKITRLITFLSGQKMKSKDVKRIEIELRATILLIARIIALSRIHDKQRLVNEDIDIGYDFVRYCIFKIDNVKTKILHFLFEIDNEKIWNKIPKITIDQSAHDHISNTAYASWEDYLPESFESLKKHLNCSSRPFIAAILGYAEIYAAIKGLRRIASDETMFILEDFEKFIFGHLNPMMIEDAGIKITFTEESLELLSNVSKWITSIIVNKFGKDEFVFNFSSTVPRHISLILFITIVEQIKNRDEKINNNHIFQALKKWTNQMKILTTVQQNPE
ncbi:MAG: hypothetical protein ACTSXA_10840 [Candidatus Heimdallarchaeota archaeon]